MITIRHFFMFILLAVSTTVFSQKVYLNTEFNYFFDNTEFAKSNLTIDQTMTGAVLTQEVGWRWDKNHKIVAGIDVMKIPGSHSLIDDAHLLSYYQYEDKKTLFNAGVFHRHDLLDDYSNLLFQDSIGFYKHTMEGLYLMRGDDKQFVKLWLDWTGYQSPTERESFMAGVSFHKSLPRKFYTNFQSYLFHFATTRPNPLNMSVSDNILGQLSFGYRNDKNSVLDKLNVATGVMLGYERDRHEKDQAYLPVGLVLQADFEYKRVGVNNIFYLGDKRMKYYSRYGNQLYWSNPFLQENYYLQNKIYWNFFEKSNVRGQIASRTHLSEGKLFFEQMLVISASLHR